MYMHMCVYMHMSICMCMYMLLYAHAHAHATCHMPMPMSHGHTVHVARDDEVDGCVQQQRLQVSLEPPSRPVVDVLARVRAVHRPAGGGDGGATC